MAQVEQGPRGLTVLDGRTGRRYSIEILEHGLISASALKKITAGGDGVGLRVYDPGYTVTAAARSSISHAAGAQGTPHYRGMPLTELIGKTSFSEVAYLLIYGQLPTSQELSAFEQSTSAHSQIPLHVQAVIKAMPHTAHPMTLMMAGLSALGGCYPDQNPAVAGQAVYKSPEVQDQQIARILGKISTLAATIYHKHNGSQPTPPKPGLSHVENFLYMIGANGNLDYRPDPPIVKAFEDVMLLNADDGMCCSTAAVRHLASSGVDVFTAMTGGVGALAGVLDGGSVEAVGVMLKEIGTPENIPAYLQQVKAGHKALYGFGCNPASTTAHMRKVLKGLSDLTAEDPMFQIAMALQAAVASDGWFTFSGLQHPDLQFYSALVYSAMGFQPHYFPVLTTVARAASWCAHWRESLADPATKIARPQQDYRGHWIRHYKSLPVREPQSPEVPEPYWSPKVPEACWSPEVPEGASPRVPGQQVLIMSATSGTIIDTTSGGSSSSSGSSGRGFGSDSGYYRSLGRAGNAAVMASGSSISSSRCADVLDQLGNVRVAFPELSSGAAAASSNGAGSSSSSNKAIPGSDSSYYRSLGRVARTGSSSSSPGSRDKLDSATLRIPGWSPRVPAGGSSSSSGGGGDLLDQLGLVRVVTSGTWGDTAAGSRSSSKVARGDSSYYSMLQKANKPVAGSSAAAAAAEHRGSSSSSGSRVSADDSNYYKLLQNILMLDSEHHSAAASSSSTVPNQQLGLVRVAAAAANVGYSSSSSNSNRPNGCDSSYYGRMQALICSQDSGGSSSSNVHKSPAASSSSSSAGKHADSGSHYYKVTQKAAFGSTGSSSSEVPGHQMLYRSHTSGTVGAHGGSGSSSSSEPNGCDSNYYASLQRSAGSCSAGSDDASLAATATAATAAGSNGVDKLPNCDSNYFAALQCNGSSGSSSANNVVANAAVIMTAANHVSSGSSSVQAARDGPVYPPYSNAYKRKISGENWR